MAYTLGQFIEIRGWGHMCVLMINPLTLVNKGVWTFFIPDSLWFGNQAWVDCHHGKRDAIVERQSNLGVSWGNQWSIVDGSLHSYIVYNN